MQTPAGCISAATWRRKVVAISINHGREQMKGRKKEEWAESREGAKAIPATAKAWRCCMELLVVDMEYD
jgi:hypothetical protein